MKKVLFLPFAFCAFIYAGPFAPIFECEITDNAEELGFDYPDMKAEVSADSSGKYCWYTSKLYGKLLRAKFKDGVLTTYYANGNPRATEPTKNGKTEGWQKLYYENGTVESKFYAKEGEAEGLYTSYYKSGILNWETPYKKGLASGISKGYYESGKKYAEIPYLNGKMHGNAVFFCEDGRKAGGGKFVNGELEGYMESTDGVRGNEDFEVVEHYCRSKASKAYDLMKNQKFTKDIDRVLKDVAGLQTTGNTVLDSRRGKADGGFNEGYAEGGFGGIGDGLANLLGGGGGGIATKAKGSIKTPSERDIIVNSGSEFRSAADIMKVVRQRTPSLRHIFNKFLKKKPGLQGKVTLKFTIASGGEIISIFIASSTTGYGEFDNEIKSAVSRWKFSKVKSGKTMVSIPFTFSE